MPTKYDTRREGLVRSMDRIASRNPLPLANPQISRQSGYEISSQTLWFGLAVGFGVGMGLSDVQGVEKGGRVSIRGEGKIAAA
jgi:hypothetical protein